MKNFSEKRSYALSAQATTHTAAMATKQATTLRTTHESCLKNGKSRQMTHLIITMSITLAISLVIPVAAQAKDKKTSKETIPTENRNFEISKNFDILHSIFRELDANYVDSTKVDEVFKNTIYGMLSSYDPYTDYISKEDMSDLKFITTGEYAGIGSGISMRDNKIIITEPYEGMPAQLAGLYPGDEITEIDGEKMAGHDANYASERLRGEPNTVVKLTLKRDGEKKLLHREVTRQRIVINQVRYYGMVGPETGYIYLSSFTDKSYSEVLHAFKDLKAQGAKKMILDLRSNGGGLLTEAVSICNIFVPKGEHIVSTKGRDHVSDRVYKTMREPIDTEIPLVVLVNNGSASASEIVSGSLQDLDRAVIVGTRTYGKGLVQQTRELPYEGAVKVTVAKYYIPSGRCIQAIDWSNRNEDGSVGRIPDSLANDFDTRHGRIVRDGGGISPDVTVELDDYSSLTYQLAVKQYFFDYANKFFREHEKIAPVKEFSLTDEDYSQFCQYVIDRGIKYDLRSQQLMKELKKALKLEGYYEQSSDVYEALEKKLTKDTAEDLKLFRKEIEPLLTSEIVMRYYYQRGEIEQGLKDDKTVKKALEILDDSELYHSMLTVAKVGEAEEKED